MTIDAADATRSVTSPKRKGWIASSGSDNLISLIGFLLLVCAWELAIYLFEIPDYILPAPSAIAKSLYNGFASGTFVYIFLLTAIKTLAGFVLPAFLATAL